jgi:hypothetical protein
VKEVFINIVPCKKYINCFTVFPNRKGTGYISLFNIAKLCYNFILSECSVTRFIRGVAGLNPLRKRHLESFLRFLVLVDFFVVVYSFKGLRPFQVSCFMFQGLRPFRVSSFKLIGVKL